MSDMTNAYNHLRRFWAGKLDQKQLATELGVSIALANKFAKHNKPENLPKVTDLPAGIDDIINETDFRITVRGHHTKCWIWDKNRRLKRDPISGQRKDITEVIYRIYSGKSVPGSSEIVNKCGQSECINYEHFSIVKKSDTDIINRIKIRKEAEISKFQKTMITKLSKRYNWTEKEQCAVFLVSILDIKD